MADLREQRNVKNPCPCGNRDKKDKMHVPMHGEKISDVLGSYTGMTRDGEKPVQDADDL